MLCGVCVEGETWSGRFGLGENEENEEEVVVVVIEEEVGRRSRNEGERQKKRKIILTKSRILAKILFVGFRSDRIGSCSFAFFSIVWKRKKQKMIKFKKIIVIEILC